MIAQGENQNCTAGQASSGTGRTAMMSRQSIQFSVRALLVCITICACVFAYEFNWIRKRRAFLVHQEALGHTFSQKTAEIDYSLPRVEILSRTVASPGILWWFGEKSLSSLDVAVVVDDKLLDLTCDILSYEEVQVARLLFPEAQLVVGIVPKSVMEGD